MSKFKLNAESTERMGAEGGGGDIDYAGEAETSISLIDAFISQTDRFASKLGDKITYSQFQEIIFRSEAVRNIMEKKVGQEYPELRSLYDHLQNFVNGFFEESLFSEHEMSEIVDSIKDQFQSQMQRYFDEKKITHIDALADILSSLKFDEGNTQEMEADGMDVDVYAPTPAPTMAPTMLPIATPTEDTTVAPTPAPTSSAANRRPLHNGFSSVRAIIRAAEEARREVEKAVAEKAAAEKAAAEKEAAAGAEDQDSDVEYEYEYETTEAPTMAPTIAPTVVPTIENQLLSIAGSVDCFFDILK